MPSLTYKAKKDSVCPVCKFKFRREELLTGGGRMNAGELTDELHRVYLPTAKFGNVYPLIYPVSVCPQCWYAAYPRHFEKLDMETRNILELNIGERKSSLKPLFSDIDFDRGRGINEGVASYALAAFCYDKRPSDSTPTFMRALSCLRAGWLSGDLHGLMPAENYDYLSKIFLRKASFFYTEVLEAERKGEESLDDAGPCGPDLDNNYGFDGILYLVGVLQFKYGQTDNKEHRIESLKKARSAVSRIVGMGKSSKSKPSALLDLSRELHKSIKQELEDLEGAP